MVVPRGFKVSWSATLRRVARRYPDCLTAFAIEETNLSEGLRAAFASTTMLLVGMYFHKPDYAWAAIGAFWTCLADASVTSRMRLASMLSFSALSTIAGGLTAYAAGFGTPTAAAAILIFAALAGLTRMWGMAAHQVAILAATACTVMVDHPLKGAVEGAALLGTYLGGCLFATLLGATLWRIRRFGPGRHALRSAYSQLSDLARYHAQRYEPTGRQSSQARIHSNELRGRLQLSFEALRRTLHDLPWPSTESHQPNYVGLLHAFADAERIFAGLNEFADCKSAEHCDGDRPTRNARCLLAIAEILKRMGNQIARSSTPYPYELRERLSVFAGRLDPSFSRSLSCSFKSEDIAVLLSQPRDHWLQALIAVVDRSWETAKHNVSIRSIYVQHAVRLAGVTTTTFLVVRGLHIQYGYWATMAVLLILQPSVATTWPRAVARAVGSTLGAGLAVAIGSFIHTPLAISLTVFPMICLTMSLRRVSYSLYVVFLTPSFVLVADYALPATGFIHAIARLENNVIGCAIALAATYLLLPRGRIGDTSAPTGT